MGFSLLVVEDEPDLNEIITETLRRAGFIVKSTFSLKEAKSALIIESFNLVVLDMNLPDGKGRELIIEIQKMNKSTQILVLTSNNHPRDVDETLKMAVSDYMIKPFRGSELTLRINNILNRAQTSLHRERVYSFGSCLLDYSMKRVQYNNKQLLLNSKEFELLYVLLVNQGRVVSREFVYRHIWGEIDVPDMIKKL